LDFKIQFANIGPGLIRNTHGKNVTAGTECGASARQHEATHFIVRAERTKCACKGIGHISSQSVQPIRPIECYVGDATLNTDLHFTGANVQ
jgi:hypothetical protein